MNINYCKWLVYLLVGVCDFGQDVEELREVLQVEVVLRSSERHKVHEIFLIVESHGDAEQLESLHELLV